MAEQAVNNSGGAKKQGFFKRVGHYIKDLKNELKRLVWPTKKETFVLTATVLGVIAVVGAFVWGLDFVLNAVIQWVLGRA